MEELTQSEVLTRRTAARREDPVSVGHWVATLLLTLVPVFGVVLLVAWAFGGDTAPSKANWARAALIVGGLVTLAYLGLLATALFSVPE